MMDKGVLYIATGSDFVREAVLSNQSFKLHNPSAGSCLMTDEDSITADVKQEFDHIIALPNPTFSWLDKIAPLVDSPFEKTLFLDSDTLVLEPLDDVFEALDRFEVGFAHASYRKWDGYEFGVPDCFAEPNSGVIAYRRSERFSKFVDEWLTIYKKQIETENPYGPDQPTFRKALYESDLRLLVMPPEYNWRTIFAGFVGGATRVKILHGRHPSLTSAAKHINKGKHPRVYDFQKRVTLHRAFLKFKRMLFK